MASRTLASIARSAPLHTAFAISRGSKMCAETVQVELAAGRFSGRGEGVPYARYGETVDGVMAAIEAVRPELEAGAGRAEIADLLPPGAARCALDCALWDLQAKQSGRPVWQAMGLTDPPHPVETAMTIGLDAPAAMADAARTVPGALLKLKLGGPGDMARVAAVHEARPDARLILDGNEAISPADLGALAGEAAGLGVVLIEQPLPAGGDSALRRGTCAVPICADESAHTAADIPDLAERYDAVNIKLDKTGGLTAALEMLDAARRAGLTVMVGCMVAGSLSMAPALLLAQAADFADLDGPLWLTDDIANGLSYAGGTVAPPSPDLWG